MVIDMVFTDINLIGAASGWDVGECFHAARPKVPVLYTSAQVIELERYVPNGVFIAKPYRHNDILNSCQRLLQQMTALGLGCSLIPGVGSSLREHPCRVQGSLRGRGVPSA